MKASKFFSSLTQNGPLVGHLDHLRAILQEHAAPETAQQINNAIDSWLNAADVPVIIAYFKLDRIPKTQTLSYGIEIYQEILVDGQYTHRMEPQYRLGYVSFGINGEQKIMPSTLLFSASNRMESNTFVPPCTGPLKDNLPNCGALFSPVKLLEIVNSSTRDEQVRLETNNAILSRAEALRAKDLTVAGYRIVKPHHPGDNAYSLRFITWTQANTEREVDSLLLLVDADGYVANYQDNQGTATVTNNIPFVNPHRIPFNNLLPERPGELLDYAALLDIVQKSSVNAAVYEAITKEVEERVARLRLYSSVVIKGFRVIKPAPGETVHALDFVIDAPNANYTTAVGQARLFTDSEGFLAAISVEQQPDTLLPSTIPDNAREISHFAFQGRDIWVLLDPVTQRFFVVLGYRGGREHVWLITPKPEQARKTFQALVQQRFEEADQADPAPFLGMTDVARVSAPGRPSQVGHGFDEPARRAGDRMNRFGSAMGDAMQGRRY